jgi:Bacterial Ig domain
MQIRKISPRIPRCAVKAVALALLCAAGAVSAAGTLAPAPQRVDMVHDDLRGLIYITQGGEVLRYHIASGTYLSPIVLGGRLRGVDLSADQSTLAVADDMTDATRGWVHLVSLNDLTYRTAPFVKDSYESGTFSVGFGADDKLYATTDFWGSGWTPMRRLDTSTDTWAPLASVRQASMLAPSGDGETIAFAESNSSDGPWGLLDIPTGQIVRRNGYTNGTSWYNYEIATDRIGSQFAIPTYGGTFVYDDAYQKVATIGQYAGPQPIGAAYHPVERIAYFPWAESSQVRVYDMNTFSQTGSYDFENTFSTTGNRAFAQGRTRLSRDGSLLMVSVTGGVRFLQMYAPLNAAPTSANAIAGTPVSIALPGTIGNGGSLQFSIVRAPVHGNVSLSGSNATYTGQAGYAGNDSFRYRVQYGRASREADVQLTVARPNTPPVALDDNASARRTPILIPVLKNDSDADGDALTITSVTRPAVGSASIEAGQIRFTPPRSWSGTVSFNYTISDGRGGQATATVRVVRF